MNHNMKAKIVPSVKNGMIAYPAILSLLLYVFCYQFAYPFSSTFFLYIAFAGLVVWLFFGQKIYLSTQMLLMGLVTLVSAVGVIYTDNPAKGNREAILTAVTFVFLIALAQDNTLLGKLKKIVCVCSFVVLFGVMFQYLFSDAVNSLLGNLLRTDCYEHLMWSYTVDGAYAGFSAYTADAAYFVAVLFGFMIFGWLQNPEMPIWNKVFRLVVGGLSVFAVILTSKRGVAVALLIALVMTYMIWKRVSAKTMVKMILLIVACAIVLFLVSQQNAIVRVFIERFDSADGDITTGRSEIWKRAIEAFRNAIFGMGTGSAYTVYDAGLHNIYLQLFYDHGVIGALVYVMFFLYNLVGAIRRREPMSIYVQLLMLVYGMSGNPIYSNSFFIIYVIFSVVTARRVPEPTSFAAGKEQLYHESRNFNFS